jgi:hypothetical protein
VYLVDAARMKEESPVEDEGARCGTQHNQRLDQPQWRVACGQG